MKYITDDAVEFFVVPDCAWCALEGDHPDRFFECPRTGELLCRPYSCIHYEEEWT